MTRHKFVILTSQAKNPLFPHLCDRKHIYPPHHPPY
jgi:hypothetical protein